jgi:hypothetical protein
LRNSRNSVLFNPVDTKEETLYLGGGLKNFQELKKILCIAPVLALPKIGKLYKIYIDASKERRVIAYISWKLKPYEENYATHDLDLATIVLALKKW